MRLLRGDSERPARSSGLFRIWVHGEARRDDSCHTGLTAPPSGTRSTSLLVLLPGFCINFLRGLGGGHPG